MKKIKMPGYSILLIGVLMAAFALAFSTFINNHEIWQTATLMTLSFFYGCVGWWYMERHDEQVRREASESKV